MSVDLSINPEAVSTKITDFIRKTAYKAGFSKVVIGLSGGLDSATSCSLAVRALGAENVFVGLFPYGELNKEGLENAKLLIKHLIIPTSNVYVTDIKPFVDPMLSIDPKINTLRQGNIIARMRMIMLYDLSKKLNSLVLGTENRTEYLLGYFTRFGDEASDIEPIGGLYKTQVRQLAKYLQIPENIINQVPTAGLWTGQTDEGDFGFTYEEADKILNLYFDRKYPVEKIGKEGLSQNTIKLVLERVEKNAYKHNLPFKY